MFKPVSHSSESVHLYSRFGVFDDAKSLICLMSKIAKIDRFTSSLHEIDDKVDIVEAVKFSEQEA